ncbi:MAG: acyltransferase [Bacteroidales bacterium]|jgi:peptidoglycan/LPS O-acetylase OafA/YrhL|nr:acyltransferase [Bacteroidales bacterium]
MKRDSNIELLRIVAMFLIVVHHYCVNSGLIDLFDFNNITGNTILVQLLSFGGKVGVTIFFIISGFFMINSKFKLEKVVKLIFQILFYSWLIMAILMLCGYRYSIIEILADLNAGLVSHSTKSFFTSYLLVNILSPVINKMLTTISKKEFKFLLGVLLFYFCILSTFFFNDTWNYFGWAFTCYCVGAYIRKHTNTTQHNTTQHNTTQHNIISFFICLILTYSGILILDFTQFLPWTFMISNANKLLLFMMAVNLFMIFKNIRIKYNKIINTAAASCLGVLLIHASSNTMRQWLWKDFLCNVCWFESSWMWIHLLVSCITIYIVCTLIDMARIQWLEKPLFKTKFVQTSIEKINKILLKYYR